MLVTVVQRQPGGSERQLIAFCGKYKDLRRRMRLNERRQKIEYMQIHESMLNLR